MTRQPDHADVVTEILATELRADTCRLGDLEDLCLHIQIAKRLTELSARRRKRIEIPSRGELGQLQRILRASSADNEAEMIRRAGGRAEGPDLFIHPRRKARRIEECFRLLEQQALVG